jgi:hypothetical protein
VLVVSTTYLSSFGEGWRSRKLGKEQVMLGEEDAGGAVPEKVDPPLRLDERALASGSDKGKLRAIAQRLLVTSALGASSRRCGVRGRLLPGG